MSWLAIEDGEPCAVSSRPAFVSDAAIPCLKSPPPPLLRPLYHFPFFHAASFLPVLSVPFPSVHDSCCRLLHPFRTLPTLPQSTPSPLSQSKSHVALWLSCPAQVYLSPCPIGHVRLATCPRPISVPLSSLLSPITTSTGHPADCIGDSSGDTEHASGPCLPSQPDRDRHPDLSGSANLSNVGV